MVSTNCQVPHEGDHETQVVETLTRLFGPEGFEPDHVAGVTVNRYGHGYGLFDGTPRNESYLKARTAYGRISIAHADSEGAAWAHAAIDAAGRAVGERLAF